VAERGYTYSTTPSGVHRAVLYGLVPDGVGAVSFAFEHGVRVALTVTDNLATGPRPAVLGRVDQIAPKLQREPKRLRALVAAAIPTSITWYSAPGGAVVRTFARPPGLLARTLRVLDAALALRVTTTTTATGGCSSTTVDGRRAERCTSCVVKVVDGRRERSSCRTTTTPAKRRRLAARPTS
jgi:hypothetical protein